ncbi:unnamed protein product [Periconia digitata]|uniref:Uncharacterized protein n=1 Tax=Periconia digitata TaxID=1303443 RepID=A0A9W4UJY1_9PLEO|nr:unnamed protein product [Periconia digitata]
MATLFNPNVMLDNIGISIANLQAACSRSPGWGSPRQAGEGLKAQAKRLDDQLLTWARCMPIHWRPNTLISGRDFDPTIPSYLGLCDNYPSCQIALVWHLWRLQRLTLLKLMLVSSNTSSPYDCSSQTLGSCTLNDSEYTSSHREVAQDLVDSVCRSTPFHLGNRSLPSSMTDFDNLDIVILPGYSSPDALQSDSDYNQYRYLTTQSDEHRHHVIAQGAWHMMNSLSRLLELLSEEPTIANLLRPGQHQWIRSQFLRVRTSLHIPSAGYDDVNHNNISEKLLAN